MQKKRESVGYNAIQESNEDETLLKQYHQLYENALSDPHPDRGFMEFVKREPAHTE